MGRTNVPIDDDLHARLSKLKGDRTWNELLSDAADALEGDDVDDDTATQAAPIPTDQAEEIARMAAENVENRMTRH